MIAYVISLPGATTRLERTSNEFKRYCPWLKWLVPDVCDAREWSDVDLLKWYDSAAAKKRYRRDLCAGEVGCTLSHLAALRAFLATEEENCLIVEDDVLFSPGIGDFLLKFDATNKNDRELPRVTILTEAARVRYWTSRSWIGTVRRTRPLEVWGSVCYIVNRRAAELILQINSTPIFLQADSWGYYVEKGLNVFGVSPVLAGSFDYSRRESTLSKERMLSYQKGLARQSIARPCLMIRLIKYGMWKGKYLFELISGVCCLGRYRTNSRVFRIDEREGDYED